METARFGPSLPGSGPAPPGAIRRFAGWVARGSVGHPMLDGINYWDELKDSPSQIETCFAIFAHVLELDDHDEPVNEKYTEQRAATYLAVPVLHRTTPARQARPRTMGMRVALTAENLFATGSRIRRPDESFKTA
ncbi:hypothetical protein AB0B88_10370 [Micromonospora haikouensis]|uniref:DUF7677 family protein n=1 Tax=Micromonospora haikouensis TaxID=686309 RepID=UPI0033EDF0B4